MEKQVLILNGAGVGGLMQTIPLLARLHQECPGVAIDLVVDGRLAPIASCLPGLRHVLGRDLAVPHALSHCLEDENGPGPDWTAPVQSLTEVGYGRVINLTHSRWSAKLASMVGAPDVRGGKVTPNGGTSIGNAWFTYLLDLHHFRRLNRFHRADLYALGGSGIGSYQPMHLAVPSNPDDWARRFLHTVDQNTIPIAVQVGASDPVKAWRPEYFGQTMAALSRRAKVAFVLIGTAKEAPAVAQAVVAYHAAGGSAKLCNALGQTTLPQLAALLKCCRLMLTNDTGPMQVAVGVETPVIDLSVGHAALHESGPFSPGHWVIQPTLGCAPCDYGQACSHHACKDQVPPEEVADLCLHVLGLGSFPARWTGVRVYESGLDADGLTCFHLRAGQEESISDWYGRFWRRYWYERYTGMRSRLVVQGPPPDLELQRECFRWIGPRLDDLLDKAASLSRLEQEGSSSQVIAEAQTQLVALRQEVLATALQSWAFGPVTVLFMRDLQSSAAIAAVSPPTRQVSIHREWAERIRLVMELLQDRHDCESAKQLISGLTGSEPKLRR